MEFQVTSGEVYITDPCYEEPENVVPAQNGTWKVYCEVTEEPVWGGHRVTRLVAEHTTISDINNISHLSSGVDSGQCGVFDAGSYPLTSHSDRSKWYDEICKLTLKEPYYGVYSNGVCSSSGMGDGDYPVTISDYNGKAVKIEIDFLINKEEEEDYYDGDDGDDGDDEDDEDDE